MCIFRLEVSYKCMDLGNVDEKISQLIGRTVEHASEDFGRRDLVFSFESLEDRKACLDKIDNDLGYRITLYEIQAA